MSHCNLINSASVMKGRMASTSSGRTSSGASGLDSDPRTPTQSPLTPNFSHSLGTGLAHKAAHRPMTRQQSADIPGRGRNSSMPCPSLGEAPAKNMYHKLRTHPDGASHDAQWRESVNKGLSGDLYSAGHAPEKVLSTPVVGYSLTLAIFYCSCLEPLK